MVVEKTKCGDETVNGFADRDALRAQGAVIRSRGNGKRFATCRENLEVRELHTDLENMRLGTKALKELAQDDVGQTKALLINLLVEPVRLGICHAAEIIDPHACINDDHRAV